MNPRCIASTVNPVELYVCAYACPEKVLIRVTSTDIKGINQFQQLIESYFCIHSYRKNFQGIPFDWIECFTMNMNTPS